jgi:hypothetical protein
MGEDEEQERGALARELAWLTEKTRGYRHVIRRLPDGCWYWHLYWNGERVNGGLSPTEADARADARNASVRHIYTRDTRPVMRPYL